MRTAFLAGLLLLLFGAALPAGTAQAKKPNVLLIVSDDLNCQLGCYGNRVVQTPNIDRLAARGVRFERAYCNYPVCNASRTSFLSGRYPETTGVLGNGTQPRIRLGADFRFLPEYFHDQGYFTAGIGKIAHGTFIDSVKWDVVTDPVRGEEAEEGAAARPRRRRLAGAAPAPDPLPFAWQATENRDEQEPDGVIATRVVKLLEEKREGPFFIAAGFHRPHVPHTAPKKYFDMYPPEKMPLPAEPPDHTREIPPIARPGKYFPDLTDAQKQAIISHYYAATTFMDAQVGRLLAAMDQLKLWDNTIVVFLGDHGWHHGEHGGFWAKVSAMNESARAPLIVAAPGKKAKAVSPRLVEFVDLYPTLVDLCGLRSPAGLQGTSFRPLLENPQRPGKSAVFTVVTRRGGLGRAVRTEQYTYIEWPDGSAQLYDARRDPKEYDNLANDPPYAKTVAELKERLKAGPLNPKP